MSRRLSNGCGIVNGKVVGKSVKKLQRKNKRNKNLPYWKPFLMQLLCRRNPKQHKNVKKIATTTCVKEAAAKICHSPKSEETFMAQWIQEITDSVSKLKENYLNYLPTYGGFRSISEYRAYEKQVEERRRHLIQKH